MLGRLVTTRPMSLSRAPQEPGPARVTKPTLMTRCRITGDCWVAPRQGVGRWPASVSGPGASGGLTPKDLTSCFFWGWLTCPGGTRVGGLVVAAAEAARVWKDLTRGQGIVPAPQREGSAEAGTWFKRAGHRRLPRRVGEKRQSTPCSLLHDTGPVSPALPVHGLGAQGCPPGQEAWTPGGAPSRPHSV